MSTLTRQIKHRAQRLLNIPHISIMAIWPPNTRSHGGKTSRYTTIHLHRNRSPGQRDLSAISVAQASFVAGTRQAILENTEPRMAIVGDPLNTPKLLGRNDVAVLQTKEPTTYTTPHTATNNSGLRQGERRHTSTILSTIVCGAT